jgi:hypothetical protein
LELQGLVSDPIGPVPLIKAEFDSADKENGRRITAADISLSILYLNAGDAHKNKQNNLSPVESG